ncbi:MAG: DUF6516 family protein [Promethearchaeia archaeon]
MKSVLKRAEKASRDLNQLKLQDVKLTRIKIAENNPETGNFRLKGYFSETEFIEIFQFYLSGKLLKYSYVYIKDNNSILRYDNAPHHEQFKSFPDHKHIKERIKGLEDPTLKNFIAEVLKIKTK